MLSSGGDQHPTEGFTVRQLLQVVSSRTPEVTKIWDLKSLIQKLGYLYIIHACLPVYLSLLYSFIYGQGHKKPQYVWTTFRSYFSLCTVWDLGIEPRMPGLGASTFFH